MFYMMFFFLVIMVIMIIGFSKSALVHLYGLLFGILFGLALYPRMPEVAINENIDKLFKIFSVAFLGLAVLLGLIV
jgi:membrane associated rhomboid family serine protease